MSKVKCPHCGVTIKVKDGQISREGEKYMMECSWCHKRMDLKAQLGPQFKIDGDNSPDEFWNKIN